MENVYLHNVIMYVHKVKKIPYYKQTKKLSMNLKVSLDDLRVQRAFISLWRDKKSKSVSPGLQYPLKNS
jgi:hypothetical protein